MKKLMSLFKLNEDPDILDLGIIGFDVIVEIKRGENCGDEIKTLINGMSNSKVLPEHRTEELDVLENIVISNVEGSTLEELNIPEETQYGLYSYYVRTQREPNRVFKIICP